MIVVVPVEPPWEECLAWSLEATDDRPDAGVTALYEAAVTDVIRTVRASGGRLLVNYRDEETLPSVDRTADAAAACRALVDDAVSDPEEVRFERQIGSTVAARIGNTVTHLLEQEDAGIVGVIDPLTPLVSRAEIDGAAMSARRNDVVLGSDGAGDVYLSVFAEPIDFDGAYDSPALATLAERAATADRAIGFAPTVPRIATTAGLAATIATIDARRAAKVSIPEATASVLDEWGFHTDDGVSIDRH